jgi:hypothetical protein
MFATQPSRRTVRPTGDHDASPRKRTVRSLIAMLVAAGSVAALAGPAQAYDRGKCNSMMGTANVESVDSVRMNTGTLDEVDFGDDPHWLGTAEGDAVVCWNKDGRVAVRGRLFADPSAGTVTASVSLVYYRNSMDLASWRSSGITAKVGDWVKIKDIEHAPDALPSGLKYNKVRIRLYNGDTPVATRYEYR